MIDADGTVHDAARAPAGGEKVKAVDVAAKMREGGGGDKVRGGREGEGIQGWSWASLMAAQSWDSEAGEKPTKRSLTVPSLAMTTVSGRASAA